MIAEVIVNVESKIAGKPFDYVVPNEMKVTVGERVFVPFGNRKIDGYIVSTKDTSTYDSSKLKEIIKKEDKQPLLSENMVKVCFFMQNKFYIRLGDAIKLFLPPFSKSGKIKAKMTEYVKLNVDTLPNLSKSAKKQLEILLFLQEKNEAKQSEISSKFGLSPLKTLIEKGYVSKYYLHENRSPENKFKVEKKDIVLNSQQIDAIDTIIKSKYQTFLLHGVTGSGKTEVYINCIQDALRKGKTAIMLVPEISLTPQMFARFKNAFGDTVAILHSSLSQGERFDEWNRLKDGKAKIAIGARSCIFAPIQNVGIIVIDEEHDSSYYSESNPRFHTHEVARYIAYLNNCPLILGSATPSVESFYLAKQGEYRIIRLTNRANEKELPAIEIVDMLGEIRSGNTGVFSQKFLNELDNCIKAGHQAMIFINRRGFSSFVMCRECGYVPKCEDCDVSLVYHKEDNMLKCHYCNKRYKALTKCPKCGSPSIRFGAVGTQRVVEELKNMFEVPIFRLDNDSTQNKNSYIDILENFNHTSPSILVGTQMIAKGHDFNNVTLVGIVDADVSLNVSDYRAIERTFSLITQVSGRAGRSESEGKVILQTYYPKHFAYRCASTYDYGAFFKKEISLREVAHFPPFVSLLRVLVMSEFEKKAEEETHAIFTKIKELKEKFSGDFVYLSAMKCPRKRIEKKFRFQIMLRIVKRSESVLIPKIYEICDTMTRNGVSVFVENDPQNLS
ncbi:MAG: primosomal protein N' [Clostridia bacterium]|nr:primosomal protein N' [Clostridia bacterium]